LFNSSGDPVDAQTSSGFASFILQYQQQAGQTGYRGIYFVDQLEEETAKGYVVVVPIYRLGRNVGYAAIVLTLKKVIPRNVYPQLLVDNRFAQDFNARDFSFAIFHRDSLVSSSGDYDYQRHFPAPASGEQVREEPGIQHIIVEGENDRKAVISSPVYPWKNVVANFAFWVLVGVVVVFLWLVIMSYYYYRKARKLNYATRIQIYVYLAFIIPLLAVSITTINWTSQSALQQLENEFGKKTRILAEGISPPFVSYLSDSSDLSSFENEFSSACRFADVDASIYSPSGKLIATSQPLIFDTQILTKWINPNALNRARQSTASFTLEEHVGNLAYNSSYASLRSPQTGELIGILSVPFFDSASSLEIGRIAIFSNVVIIFVVILLFFTLLSFVATRWLTFPLQLITRSLSKMSLKEDNRLLDWKADDEIGLMIREYNRMVQNLNRNKIELARSQKESAWREMAQQVAHEIKNPLTPMKLTVQQLELTLRSGELSREKANKAIETLLAQLEILNEIASSFSNFAKMPAPILHSLDVGEQVRKVEQLYQNHPLGSVRWAGERSSWLIRGDDQLLNRILSNLVLNGLQSGREGQQVNVSVTVELLNSRVRIQVKDDGMGMEDSVKERIFVPNFTTKKWGTGLGLAIVKQGVEQMGGAIQLISEPGVGTTFILEFPVAE
jgi:signal transduction histidine kinase